VASDPHTNPRLQKALRVLAPGTELREAVDDIIKGEHMGGLLVIADRDAVAPIASGGIVIDAPFSAQVLYELAKMDGAIILSEDLETIRLANVQLMPDPDTPTSETGTRHRTAERVARQIDAIALAISQERNTVNVYTGGSRYQLDSIQEVLTRVTQALATLQSHRTQLDRGADSLSVQEFRGTVTLDDVLVVVQRAEMAQRMIADIGEWVLELGNEGRLVEMQLAELADGVADERVAVIRDYRNAATTSDAERVLAEVAGLAYRDLLEFAVLARVLGYPEARPLEQRLKPRGYRALACVPSLTADEVERIVAAFSGFDALTRASLRELEQIEGIPAERAREVQHGLRRLHDHVVQRSANSD